MTEDLFFQLCEQLSSHIWLQALIMVAGTCFLEDAARCGIGLLVAADYVGWWMAFVSMTIGGMISDMGLYFIGRYATMFLIHRRWVDAARLEGMKTYFQHHAIKAVMIARFIPGARTIAYVSAGAICYPIPRFLLLLLIAAMIQSLIFLKLSEFIAEKILPYLHNPKIQVAAFAVIVLVLVLIHHTITRRNKRKGLPIVAKLTAEKKPRQDV